MRYLVALTLIVAFAASAFATSYRLPDSGFFTEAFLLKNGQQNDNDTPSLLGMTGVSYTFSISRTSEISDNDHYTIATAWITNTTVDLEKDSRDCDPEADCSASGSGLVSSGNAQSHIDADRVAGTKDLFKDMAIEYSLY